MAKTKVLVIDDDKQFASGAAEELGREGFEVECAFSYTEAMQKLEQARYDVVSLDIMMRIEPDEEIDRDEAQLGRSTGLLIYRQLRKRWPQTKVVVFSVLAAEDQGRQLIASEIDPRFKLIAKPVRVAPYVAEIRAAAGV